MSENKSDVLNDLDRCVKEKQTNTERSINTGGIREQSVVTKV